MTAPWAAASSFEGLTDAGACAEPMIVILNDNGMSIDPNVGGMARHLARQRQKPSTYAFKKRYRKVLEYCQRDSGSIHQPTSENGA